VKLLLEACLNSVLQASKGLNTEIFVVDNQSTDDSEIYLPPRFPMVRFFWLKVNKGFAVACNIGWKQSTGKFVLFLNPDTVIPEDAFRKCLDFMDKQADCGALGVRMVNGEGVFLRESKRGFPGLRNSFCKMTGLAKLFPRSAFFAGYYLGHLPEMKTGPVDILSGAFLLLRRGVLEKIGGFDERYFMYGEDIDLSYQVKLVGFQNYYFPEVSIVHHKGASTNKRSRKHFDNFYGAMGLFVKKYYRSGFRIFGYPFLLAAIKIRWFFARMNAT
jgi:GT2 family glycosyltransferase